MRRKRLLSVIGSNHRRLPPHRPTTLQTGLRWRKARHVNGRRFEAGDSIDATYFPTSAVISIAVALSSVARLWRPLWSAGTA